ncbi:EamA family transporter [Phormidium tenue FACHB-886]|nr:EamA family transporter [Phormidium tenue FACHB-886]
MQSNFSFPRSSDPLLSTSLLTIATRSYTQVRSLLGAVPPSGLVLLSSFSIQISNVFAKFLFTALGSVSTTFLCKALATLLVLLVYRPSWRNYSFRSYLPIFLLGLSMAGMGLAYYGAIERIPLGVVSTLEFLGPLGVAVIGSKRWLDFAWVALAAGGVLLIAPIGTITFDPTGVGLALLSGVCWAGYIVFSRLAGRLFPGQSGLALSMIVCTLLLALPGLYGADTALLNPVVLAIGLLMAGFGTIVPYSLEFTALKRMPPRVFGVLISIEPAIAALVGFLFLKETLDGRTLVAIALVTTAAIGVTLFGKQSANH